MIHVELQYTAYSETLLNSTWNSDSGSVFAWWLIFYSDLLICCKHEFDLVYLNSLSSAHTKKSFNLRTTFSKKLKVAYHKGNKVAISSCCPSTEENWNTRRNNLNASQQTIWIQTRIVTCAVSPWKYAYSNSVHKQTV